MIRGRGRGGPGGMMRGRGRGRGGATSQAPAVTHQQHQQQQQSSTPTTTSTATASDDPFANITGGGGIGKTSITAAKGASDHTSMGSMNSKRLPSGASGDSANLDKYFAPPLYPEVAIDKRSIKPLTSEDHFLLSKHRLIRSRNRNSPYMLKREKLYDLSSSSSSAHSRHRKPGTVRLNQTVSSGTIDNFGLGNILLTPTYFPLELAQDTLKKVKRVKKKKKPVKDASQIFKMLGSDGSVSTADLAGDDEKEDAEDGGGAASGSASSDDEGDEEDEFIVEDGDDEYDFTDDYQYTRNDDDDDMGDDDTLNAAGAGDDGPIM